GARGADAPGPPPAERGRPRGGSRASGAAMAPGWQGLTGGEQLLLQLLASLSSVLSCVGCVAILRPVLREHKESVSADRLVKKLLAVLCVLYLGCGFFMAGGCLVSNSPILCKIQGFGIQWFSLASVLWNSCMAFNMFLWVVLKKPVRVLKQMIKFYLEGRRILAVLLLNGGVMGPGPIWCWISEEHSGLRFACFYLVLGLAWLFNAPVIVAVSFHTVCRQQTRLGQEAARFLCVQQTLLMVVFVLCWMFGLVYEICEWTGRRGPLWTLCLHAAFAPLHGGCTALVYVGLRCLLRVHTAQVAQAIEDRKMQFSGGANESRRASIYAVTYNLGETSLRAARPLGCWIPPGHDIYILALQECQIPLEELEVHIKNHLRSGGTEYVAYHEAIGHSHMGFHGLIAVLVFVPKAEAEKGAFAVMRSMHNHVKGGVKFGPYVASNKGMVGFALRFYGVTLAVLGGHLASDSKGHHRLEKRHSLIRDALHRSVLTDVDVSMDVNLLFHHTILLGDLNYRVHASPEEILEIVAKASLEERMHLFNSPDWTRKRYMRMVPDAMRLRSGRSGRPGDRYKFSSHPDAIEFDLTSDELHRMSNSTSREATSQWDLLMESEELTMAMRDQVVLHNFQEHPIRFPPSFRRARGEDAGDCGDYCDVGRLRSAYTTRVRDGGARRKSKDRAVLKEGSPGGALIHTSSGSDIMPTDTRESPASTEDASLRPPSYTDRILAHSLPDCRKALVCRAYELCDAAMGSDHRPVAAVYHLRYQADERMKFNNMHLMETRGWRIFTVSVENVDVHLRTEAPCRLSDGSDSPHRSRSREQVVPEPLDGFGTLGIKSGTLGARSSAFGPSASLDGGIAGARSSVVGHWTGLLPQVSRINSGSLALTRSNSKNLEDVRSPVQRGSRYSLLYQRSRSRSFSGMLGMASKDSALDIEVLLDHAALTLTFPIPPEDPLGSAERHKLIAEESISLDYNERGSVEAAEGGIVCQGTRPLKELRSVEEGGSSASGCLRLSSRACREMGMHAGISLTGPHGCAVGQAVLCLAEALDSKVSGPRRMSVPLVLGGRCVGQLEADVSVWEGAGAQPRVQGSAAADGAQRAEDGASGAAPAAAPEGPSCQEAAAAPPREPPGGRGGARRSCSAPAGPCAGRVQPAAPAEARAAHGAPPQCAPRPAREPRLLPGGARLAGGCAPLAELLQPCCSAVRGWRGRSEQRRG
ncbi:unnamed protein product, partial [Prorocentrum cordatum]